MDMILHSPSDVKMCADCKNKRPHSSFTTNKGRIDGLNSYCKECKTWRDRQRTYGITREMFHVKLAAQDFRCAICRIENPKSMKNSIDGWNIDHDHVTGEVRGILCRPCNIAVGYAESENFENIQSYLAKHSKL